MNLEIGLKTKSEKSAKSKRTKNVQNVLKIAAVLFPMIFGGCDFSSAGEVLNSLLGGNVSATETASWNYDSKRPVCLITSDVLTLNISGDLSGKNLYLVQVNPTSSTISSDNLRTVVNSKNLSSYAYSAFSLNSSHLVGGGNSLAADFSESELTELLENESSFKYKHFVGEKLPGLRRSSSSRFASQSLSSVSANSSIAEKTWNIGDKKSVYVDTDSAMSTFSKKSATLRAKSGSCYVWIVDDYFSESAGGDKAGTEIAEKYAEKFEEMYPCITKVFGDESNEIINLSSDRISDIKTLSDTGEKINIVVYDIGDDYGKSSQTGVAGYFYSKDYYYASPDYLASNSGYELVGKSNVGKYFYIDSVFANSDFDDTISTLAHEFQHMVNFNQKNMASLKSVLAGTSSKTLSPDSNYNEMLSMLCEDMMQEKLGLEDYASPKNRIQTFNAYYSLSGMREYRNDENSVLSYCTAYAFGSWLSRQYGGAALVKEISTNSYDGNDSIVNAVNKVNGTSKTFDDLFAEFTVAVTGISSSHSSVYTHNQNAAKSISCNSYYYPMKAFDLWSRDSVVYENAGSKYVYSFSLENTEFQTKMNSYKYSLYDFNGSFVFSNYVSGVDLRPEYGMIVRGIGKYGSNVTSDTLTFSSSGASGLYLYVVIQ